MSKKGNLLLLLHAHLPFVRHPEHDDFLEERWLFEAVTETYIPLLRMFEQWESERIPFNITMSVTPPLAAMLNDPLLQERYVRHMKRLIELSEKEVERTKGQPEFHPLALEYRTLFYQTLEFFDKHGRNLLNPFRHFLKTGNLDIITCGATHGFFPLMLPVQASVRAQVQTACDHYEEVFGQRAQGIWLPECGYYPGYDQILSRNGIKYFFLEGHGLLHAEPRPKYGVYAPLQTPAGPYAFGRDQESSKQVWSAVEGYPGDANYREFYRDIGFDLDLDYIKPYIHPDGIRLNTGIKYFKITGKTNDKAPYHFERARQKTAEHAANFLFNREKQIEYISGLMDKPPVVVAPYDAELFGHWWFEGPEFLNYLIRKTAFDTSIFKLTHAKSYLFENPTHQPSQPSFSSWGYKGYAEFWLDGSNDWIYRHLHHASTEMEKLAKAFQHPSAIERRALNQAARELLLAESSDWAFIMRTGTVVSYADMRTQTHLNRFKTLAMQIWTHTIDEEWLAEVERRDNIFPRVNYTVYA